MSVDSPRSYVRITMSESKGNLDFEVGFFEALIAEDDDFVEALIPLGDVYTKLGEYEKGLQVDLKLSRLRPNDAMVHYNLACSFSLLGEVEFAFEALEKAVRLGYSDIKYMLQDQDLRNVVNHNGFADFLERILDIAKEGRSR